MTVPALGALNKFAGVCVLACALLFFIAPQAASEPARPETEGLRANRALAVLGYPVKRDDPEWSEQTEGNALLFLLRLNRANDRVARHELLHLLESAALAGGPPCLDIAAAASEGAAMRKVDITFRGDRPDEYLAEFYLQAATCYPEILAPRRATGLFARADAEKLRSFAPMPVSRTEGARATYARALSALAAAGSRSEGRSRLSEPPLDAPAVAVRFEHARHRKLVRRQDGGFDARKTEESPAKEPPAAGELAAACAELALPADCAEFVTIKPIRDTYGEIATYAAELNHFNLVLTMEAPEELAEPLLFDLIARVRQQHPALQERGGVDMPFFTFAERKYVPLSVNSSLSPESTQHSKPGQICKRGPKEKKTTRMTCDAKSSPEVEWKEFTRIFDGAMQSIGVKERNLNGSTSIEIVIPDPGFAKPPSDWEKAICEGTFPEDDAKPCWQMAAGKLKDKWLDSAVIRGADDFGHGLHVSNMIAGERAAFAIGNLPDSIKVLPPLDPERVPLVYASSKGAIVNRSYMLLSVNNGNLDNNAINSAINNQEKYAALLVYALPRHQDLPNSIPCGHGAEFCVTAHEIGIGVAPVAPLSSDCQNPAPCNDPQHWKLVVTEDVTVQNDKPNGEVTVSSVREHYHYRASTQPLLIAAPGHRLLGADATVKLGTAADTMAIEHMGFRARSGSSVAAPLVSAIAAKVMSEKDIVDPRIVKQWLLATSSPLGNDGGAQSNEDHWARVAGIVHEARALGANPSGAVVFDDSNESKRYKKFEINKHLWSEFFKDDKKPFALVRDSIGPYILFENTNRDCVTSSQDTPCVRETKERIDADVITKIHSNCGLTQKITSPQVKPACIVGIGDNDTKQTIDIYLNQNDASHIIGIRPSQKYHINWQSAK